MTPEKLSALRGKDVSRETFEKLSALVALLLKWNTRINLVGKSTIEDVWTRHILDSMQVFDISTPRGHWVDIGTGGGFPGLVVAILAAGEAPDLRVTLVESDTRKAAFLATAVRQLALATQVLTERGENLPPLAADTLSARALAPLTQLLAHAHRHLAPGGRALFPKGAAHQAEIDEALATWRFDLQEHPSKTDPRAVILAIEGLSRV